MQYYSVIKRKETLMYLDRDIEIYMIYKKKIEELDNFTKI